MNEGTHAVEVLQKIETDNQVAQVQSSLPAHDRILDLAISQGAPLEQLEKWMELKERYEKNEAKKAYHKAMAAFKANPPEILKDRHVKFSTSKGQTEYRHASLGNVVTQISKGLGQHGLSSAWKTSQAEGQVTVTCTVTHELGYSDSTSLSAGLDQSGGKNNIQALASTVSYLERYTVLALTGTATMEMDDDGIKSEPVEYIKDNDLGHIIKLHKELYNNPQDPKFWEFAGATKWEEIPLANHDKILAMLNDRKVAQTKTPKTRSPGEEG